MLKAPRSPLFAQLLRSSPSSLIFSKVCLNPSILHSVITSNTSSSSSSYSTVKTPHFSSTHTPNNKAHDLVSSKSYLGVGKSVIDRCSYLWEKKDDTFPENTSLRDILTQHGHLSPETLRRFWRIPYLKPDDFLEILVGFGSDAQDLRKVGFLWNLFRWARGQCREFSHLPKSNEVMATMLIRARMFEDAESLVFSVEGKDWVLSEIIQGYAEDSQLENTISLYDRSKARGLVLSGSCFKALLKLLIGMEREELACRVYADMIEVGLYSGCEDCFLEYVVGALSKNGKTLEAVNLIKNLKRFGVKPSSAALTAVFDGYCRKKDYEDAMNFMKEWKHIPNACVCNRMVSSLCRNLGSENAWLFVERLEALGLELDAITFGILISQCCSERKLRNALIYLSESLSRRINLDVHAYNALISGLFKEGMYGSVKNIYEEMIEKGLIIGLSTFKVLLAGYCKHRKFDEVKMLLGEMINCNIASLAPTEDALSNAFKVLGFDCLKVKVKRDNDPGLSKTEFFDSLGNGLYLETDVEEFDKKLVEILDNGMTPDFDSLILEECYKGDIEAALRIKDEAAQWGKYLSLSTYSIHIEALCASSSHIKRVIILLDETPELIDQLPFESLNSFVQYLSKNGAIARARSILDRLLKRELPLDCDACTALLLGYFQFNFGTIRDMLELFDTITEHHPDPLLSVTCEAIVKELCRRGFSDIGYIFVEEFLQRGHDVHNSSYTSLIEGFIKEQKFRKARKIIDRFLEKNMTLSAGVYQLIAPCLLKFNEAEKASSLKQNMLSVVPESAFVVYNTLVAELCRIGKMKETTLQLHEMLETKVSPDNNTLNALIQGYCRVKSLRKALEILCFIVRNDIDLSLSAYRSLIHQLFAHGRVHSVLSLEEMMKEKNESQVLVLHNILIFYLFHSGNSSLVESLLKKMHVKRLVPNSDTYNFLIYGFYKCGDASKSVKLMNTMINEGMKPNNRTLKTMICYFCSNNEVSKAVELSKMMEFNSFKHGSMVLYSITEGFLRLGQISKGELYLDRIVKNDISENINLDLIIKKYCEHGRIKTAVVLMNLMLKKGNTPNEISYSLVIKGLSVCKLFDQALDFHAEMRYKNLEPSLNSCSALVYGLCDIDKADDARKILGGMVLSGPVATVDMYNYVIDKYQAQNNLHKASELMHEMQQVGYSPNFETHWSIISNLTFCDEKLDDDDPGKGFLSRLLSEDKFLSTVKSAS